MATIEKAPRRRGSTSAIASSTCSAGCVAISAAMISESEVELNVTPRSSSSSCSSTRVDQVAVVRQRDLAARAVGALRALHRLGVLPGVRPGRRVAHVADRQLAGERAQVVLGEHLADEAELAARDDVPAAVGRRDARRLLPAVLERVQREVRQTRHLVTGRIQSEHSALIARSLTHHAQASRVGSPQAAGGPARIALTRLQVTRPARGSRSDARHRGTRRRRSGGRSCGVGPEPRTRSTCPASGADSLGCPRRSCAGSHASFSYSRTALLVLAPVAQARAKLRRH